jgi:competence protein ComEA
MRASRIATYATASALLAVPAFAQAPSPAAPTAPKPPAAATATPPTAPAKPEIAGEKSALIDINTASAQELSQLKGIGEARSAAIVRGRPYRGKDDLVNRKILPESAYAEIKDRIIARQK